MFNVNNPKFRRAVRNQEIVLKYVFVGFTALMVVLNVFEVVEIKISILGIIMISLLVLYASLHHQMNKYHPKEFEI